MSEPGENRRNTVTFGLVVNAVLSGIAALIYMAIGEAEAILFIFPVFIGGAGLILGITFLILNLPKAAKANWILCLVSFLIFGSCVAFFWQALQHGM